MGRGRLFRRTIRSKVLEMYMETKTIVYCDFITQRYVIADSCVALLKHLKAHPVAGMGLLIEPLSIGVGVLNHGDEFPVFGINGHLSQID